MEGSVAGAYTSVLGRCPCSGEYSKRFVEVRMKVGEQTVVLTDVPQGACPQCGSRVYKTMVLRALETLLKSAD